MYERVRNEDRQRAPAGTGSFRLVYNGKYQYRVNCIDRLGMQVRKSFTGETKEECIAKKEEFEAKEAMKAKGIDPDATIPDIVKARYKWDLMMNFSNVQGYHRNLETLKIIERGVLGKLPIAKVEKKHIQFFLFSITDYANSTIEKIFQQIKLAYLEAMNQEIITKDLMLDRDIRRPRSSKPDKKVRAYTLEEQQLIVDTIKNHKIPYGRSNYKNQLLLELYTGMRMGEINALRPQDVDLEKKIVRVSRTISKGESNMIFINERPKTAAGNREIPLSKDAEEILRQSLAAMKPNKDGLIFYDINKNTPVSTNQVCSFFKRICDKAGVEYNGQHALRHTFATRCFEAKIEPAVVKTLLGHTDIHVTIDTYTDVLGNVRRASIDQFDDYLSNA